MNDSEASVRNGSSTCWLDVVRQNVDQLRFGSVQIIVHEGRVTQVESIEKTRIIATSDAGPRGQK